jgi:prepilin-type N-terminal cleavage/methylation domain-containing protein
MRHHERVGRTAGRGQGFTLVELLVTVAVVALLVGLLVPAMGAVRRSSLETKCLSMCATWGASPE